MYISFKHFFIYLFTVIFLKKICIDDKKHFFYKPKTQMILKEIWLNEIFSCEFLVIKLRNYLFLFHPDNILNLISFISYWYKFNAFSNISSKMLRLYVYMHVYIRIKHSADILKYQYVRKLFEIIRVKCNFRWIYSTTTIP